MAIDRLARGQRCSLYPKDAFEAPAEPHPGSEDMIVGCHYYERFPMPGRGQVPGRVSLGRRTVRVGAETDYVEGLTPAQSRVDSGESGSPSSTRVDATPRPSNKRARDRRSP